MSIPFTESGERPNNLVQCRAYTARQEEPPRMELEACAEEGSLNMGTHTIVVAEKR